MDIIEIMPPDPTTTDLPDAGAGALESTWDEIDRLLAEAARLSRLDLAPREFHSQLLAQAVAALAALGGAVWTIGPQGQLETTAQLDYPRWQLGPGSDAERRHAALLAAIARGGEARFIEPHAPQAGGVPANPTDLCLLLAPALLDGECTAVLEIFQRADTPASARLGYLRLVQTLAELTADAHRNHEWRQLRDRAALAGEFDRFIDEIHRTLDPQAVAYAIANEGRRIINVDRVSVAVAERKGARLLAVSGLDVFDPRAPVVQGLEALVAAALRNGERITYSDDSTYMPIEVEPLVQAYVDLSHARLLVVVPLQRAEGSGMANRRGEPIGALVVESFAAAALPSATPAKDKAVLDEGATQRIEAVSRHATTALGNAQAHRAVPLVGTLEKLSHAAWYVRAQGCPKLAWIATGAAAIAAALTFIPADLELEARGELQPHQRRDVFAPCDAIVSSVQAEHAAHVAAGQTLLTLRKPELEVEVSRVLGDMQTARKKLSGIQAARVTISPNAPDQRVRQNELTAEEEETKQRLASLDAELQILRAQQAELQVRAPVEGVVSTWDVDRLLAARPVVRGQRLLSVANTAGPWVLEVRLPDDDAGHLMATDSSGQGRNVTYLLATDPAATYRGRVSKVAMHTEPDEKHGPHVLVTVDVDPSEIGPERRRPGATVVARIDGGRRALGYVWFHKLFDAIRKRVWF